MNWQGSVYNPSPEERKNCIVKANDLLKNGKVDEQDEQQRTALHYAVLAGDADLVNQLIDRHIAMNVIDREGYAPLHYAVNIDSLDLVNRLLDAGADINVFSDNHGTALQIAVQLGLVESVRFLLKRGSLTHLSFKDRQDSCVLQCAAHQNRNRGDDTDMKIFRVLLNNKENNCNKKCIKDIITDVACNGTIRELKSFIECGFTLPQLCDKYNLVYHSINNKNIKIFKYIYENGFLVTIMQEPKHLSSFTRALLLYDVNRFERIDIMKYLAKDDYDMVNHFFSCFLLNFAYSNGNYSDKVPKILNYFLNNGADINASYLVKYYDSNKKYPIFNRYIEGKVELVHIYLRHIVKLELTNRYVNAKFYQKINKKPEFEEYYEKCKAELERSKLVYLQDGISFFEIFVAQKIVCYAKNVKLVEALEKFNVKSEFPVYHEDLRRLFEEIENQKRIKIAIKGIAHILQFDENAHYLILENIVRYFDEDDIEDFIANLKNLINL